MDLGFHWSWLFGKFVPNTWQGYVFWTAVSGLVILGVMTAQWIKNRKG